MNEDQRKVILDANVFVSAAIQRGPAHHIVQLWLSGNAPFHVVMCPMLFGEIEDVLTRRTRLRKWITIDDARLFVQSVAVLADLVPDPVEIDAVLRDANDDYLVAVARANDVTLIVSGDKDLLQWDEQCPPVVGPAASWDDIRG